MLVQLRTPAHRTVNPDKIKVGSIFYGCTPFYDEDTDKVSVSVDEWHVRTIRKRRGSQTRWGRQITPSLTDNNLCVNLTLKNEFTWVKRSPKTGDYGWASSISPDWRKQFRQGGPLPASLFTTPLQAIKDALKTEEDSRRWYVNEIHVAKEKGDSELVDELEGEFRVIERTIKALKARIKKSRK